MLPEPLSPELALVDPELGARARAALPSRGPEAPRPRAPHVAIPAPAVAAPSTHERGRYPLWARLTAMLWVLVIGVLIGGAAIPHAQDRPHVIPPAEDALFCERPESERTLPARPFGPGAP